MTEPLEKYDKALEKLLELESSFDDFTSAIRNSEDFSDLCGLKGRFEEYKQINEEFSGLDPKTASMMGAVISRLPLAERLTEAYEKRLMHFQKELNNGFKKAAREHASIFKRDKTAPKRRLDEIAGQFSDIRVIIGEEGFSSHMINYSAFLEETGRIDHVFDSMISDYSSVGCSGCPDAGDKARIMDIERRLGDEVMKAYKKAVKSRRRMAIPWGTTSTHISLDYTRADEAKMMMDHVKEHIEKYDRIIMAKAEIRGAADALEKEDRLHGSAEDGLEGGIKGSEDSVNAPEEISRLCELYGRSRRLGETGFRQHEALADFCRIGDDLKAFSARLEEFKGKVDIRLKERIGSLKHGINEDCRKLSMTIDRGCNEETLVDTERYSACEKSPFAWMIKDELNHYRTLSKELSDNIVSQKQMAEAAARESEESRLKLKQKELETRIAEAEANKPVYVSLIPQKKEPAQPPDYSPHLTIKKIKDDHKYDANATDDFGALRSMKPGTGYDDGAKYRDISDALAGRPVRKMGGRSMLGGRMRFISEEVNKYPALSSEEDVRYFSAIASSMMRSAEREGGMLNTFAGYSGYNEQLVKSAISSVVYLLKRSEKTERAVA